MRKTHWILLAGSIFLGLTYFCLIIQNRVPISHDTFQYLQLQYIYYNELVQHKTLPLWFPFLSHGLPGNYFFTALLHLLSPLYYLFGFIGIKMNAVYMVYAQIFCYEMLFLGGTILLGTVYYRSSKPVWFTTFALIGSTIWYPQIWWNFQNFYFLPLLLYAIHRWLDSRQPNFLLCAFALGLLSVVNNPPQDSIFTFFVVLVYAIPLIIMEHHDLEGVLKNIRLRHIIVLLAFLLVAAIGLYYFIYGRNNIYYLGAARSDSGIVPLDNFLTYGGHTGFGKLDAAFTRYPGNQNIDNNLYCGFLTWFFALIAIFYVREPRALVLLGTAGILFLFSMDSVVSRTFYYAFPMGNCFRHIGLTAPVAKLFMVFYAGFGVAKFFEKDMFPKLKKLWPMAFLFIPVQGLSRDALQLQETFWHMTSFDRIFIDLLPARLLALLLLSLISLYFILQHRQAKMFFFIIMLLLSCDLWFYRYSYIVTRMPVAEKNLLELFDPYAYAFPEQRALDITKNTLNGRSAILLPVLSAEPRVGSLYDTTDTFLFTDNIVSIFRTDYAERSVMEYNAAIVAKPNAFKILEAVSGFNSNKIAFFSHINIAPDNADLLRIICLPEFAGNMIFTTPASLNKGGQPLPKDVLRITSSRAFANSNDRAVSAPIKVKTFSFNELVVDVALEEKPGQNGFLYYADAYDPNWSAFVNGKRQPVIQTNIGYKAVMIPYGHSTVRFVFGTTVQWVSITALLLLISMIAGAVLYLFKQGFGRRPDPL